MASDTSPPQNALEGIAVGAPDIDIARAARPIPIISLAQDRLGIPSSGLVPFGHDKAKISLDFIETLKARPNGKLVLVTAITPTPAGEGKTTTSVGLNDGLNRIGVDSIVCLREPSLGPCFGMKGGAAGGGRAQVVPMDDINLHFTGDMHAVSAAHNLLSAMIDNHLHWGNKLGIEPREITWPRVVDMNDRALRQITIGLGGKANGVPRETRYDISVASEVMAVLCLAENLADLERSLGDIVIGRSNDGRMITARDLEADGAMAVLLKEAIQPNLVQSIENNPAIIHGGPFANIAHGCNSVIATKTAMKLADVVVTEAGFGADLGAEKFFDIKCRKSGLAPDVVVLVCTLRALKMQGGVAKNDLLEEDVEAVARGCANLERHISNIRQFGVEPIIAVNHFAHDTPAEFEVLKNLADVHGVGISSASHWAEGGRGAVDLAKKVQAALENGAPDFKLLYPDDLPLDAKINTVATRIYGAASTVLSDVALRQLKTLGEAGYGHLPVCIAKTQYSFSTNPSLLGAPTGHQLDVRELRLSAGAGFVVAVCGLLMTMPGLPRVPAASGMSLNQQGDVVGLS